MSDLQSENNNRQGSALVNKAKNDQGVDDNLENIDDYMNYLWKNDFCPVATLLLKRVEQSLKQQLTNA